MTQSTLGNFAAINGLKLYYEIHGAGSPLILLPGGFMSIAAMGTLVPALAQTRQVIAVELQGHGHTADIDRPLRYELLADDIAALIAHLGHEQVDIFGYSLGGGVALQTAIRHPELVCKLALMSVAYSSAGWFPEVHAGMRSISPDVVPIDYAYGDITPKPTPEAWATFVGKMRQLVPSTYDWSQSITQSLKSPTLLIYADADSISPAHIAEMFALLGGGKGDGDMAGRPASQLAIIPGATHLNISTRVDVLAAIIPPFLDAPLSAE